MRVKSFMLPIAIVMLLASLAAEAHHSFGGTYLVDKTITIKGTIAQITLRAPHSFFYVTGISAQDSKGTSLRWAIEGASASQFAQQGVDNNSFRVGDPVEVVANPSRSPNSAKGRLIKITRTTDGKSWGTRAAETVD